MSYSTEAFRARKLNVYGKAEKTRSELRFEHLPKAQRDRETAHKIRIARRKKGEISPAKKFHP